MRPDPTPHNPLPRYVQVAERFIRDIGAGRLIDGQRLPPERKLAQTLDISVGTLRKSLAELEAKGLLERVQGSGNYIRAGRTRDAIYAMFRLERPSGGGLPRARVLAADTAPKPADLPDFGTATWATCIRRLRWLDDVAIAVEEIWLDGSAGALLPGPISESLYHTYQTRLGLWISHAEDRVSIDAAPGWVPSDFGKPAGATTGYVERFSWAAAPAPVEFSRTWFDTDEAVYVQRLR